MVCFDVLEHIFVADLPSVVTELFSLAEKLLVINVGCYEAAALLPNGENAHITVRNAHWWKGLIDTTALKYPNVEVLLICSETYSSGIIFESFNAQTWADSFSYTTKMKMSEFGQRPQSEISLSPEQILEFTDLLTQRQPNFIQDISQIMERNRPKLAN